MSDFDKAFVHAFYDFFLKIELNVDKGNMLTLNNTVFKEDVV